MRDVWRPLYGPVEWPSRQAPADAVQEAQETVMRVTGMTVWRRDWKQAAVDARWAAGGDSDPYRHRIRLADGVTATLLNVTALVLFNVAVYPTALMRIYFETFPGEVMTLREWLHLLRSRSHLPGFYRSVYGGTATTALSMSVTMGVLRHIAPPPRLPQKPKRTGYKAAIALLFVWHAAINLCARPPRCWCPAHRFSVLFMRQCLLPVYL